MLKAEAHLHNETRVADRKGTNETISPNRKKTNLLKFVRISEQKCGFCPFVKTKSRQKENFTRVI